MLFTSFHNNVVSLEQLGPGPKVINNFSCSTELSMKFQMLINKKISRNTAFLRLR